MSHSNQPRTPRGRWRYIGKTRRIYIRVTPIEAARIKSAADRAELSISDYMIQAAMCNNVKFLRQYMEQISST